MEQSHMPVRSRPSPADDQPHPHPGDPKTLLHAQDALPPADVHARADARSAQSQLPVPSPTHPSHEPIAAPTSTPFAHTPTTELPPIQPHHERASSASNHSLPSLSSVTSGLQPKPEPRPAPPTQWPSLNPYTVFYSPGYAKPAEGPSRPDADASAASPERYYDRRSGSVSLDDPDVRMAAEALGDLRADFVSSPPNRSTPLPTPPRDHRMATSSPPNAATDQSQPEPLLSLITASHPLLATTIEGATSAYNQSKNYSPHLKTGAEYVEGYLTPVAKAVNNIGQKTGVHTSVRWFLGSRRQGRKHQSTTDLETGERGMHKRRKARASEASDMDNRPARTPDLPSYIADRRTSVSTVDTFDTLPAYDDVRSPAYAEVVSQGAPPPDLEWKTKIVVSTSSLGVALRDNNLRSLRYCLDGLRSANAYLSSSLASLQATIEEYDAAKGARDGDDDAMTDASVDCDGLVARINALKAGIVMRIGSAIKLVSDYAGGALPDNAKNLIHQQLLSLPGRLMHLSREASSGQHSASAPDASMRDGANRVILLAKEGLQVITQVSDVIDRTIKSAEEWLETLGRRSGVQAGSLPDRTREKAPATAQWATTQSQFAAPLPDENHPMTDRV